MKKVLIIAHLFRASPRIPGLAKYLPEFGWEPIVLTPAIGEDPDSRFGPPKDFVESGIRIVETQYADTFDSLLIKKFGLNPVEGIESKGLYKGKATYAIINVLGVIGKFLQRRESNE
jgi:hypothetical protein